MVSCGSFSSKFLREAANPTISVKIPLSITSKVEDDMILYRSSVGIESGKVWRSCWYRDPEIALAAATAPTIQWLRKEGYCE